MPSAQQLEIRNRAVCKQRRKQATKTLTKQIKWIKDGKHTCDFVESDQNRLVHPKNALTPDSHDQKC